MSGRHAFIEPASLSNRHRGARGVARHGSGVCGRWSRGPARGDDGGRDGCGKIAIMQQARHLAARFIDFRRINFSHDNAGLDTRFGDDLAPGRDDEAVTECVAAILMTSTLRGRNDEGARLDRARCDVRRGARHKEAGCQIRISSAQGCKPRWLCLRDG